MTRAVMTGHRQGADTTMKPMSHNRDACEFSLYRLGQVCLPKFGYNDERLPILLFPITCSAHHATCSAHHAIALYNITSPGA